MKTKQISIPVGAYGEMINNYADSSELLYMVELNDRDETLKIIPLPAGNWKIVLRLAHLITIQDFAEH